MADRYGSALLSLTTMRPADRLRGEELVHLHLAIPPAVAAQVSLWETGQRAALTPRDAADLLWSLPVAAFLDGQPDAWRRIPGVADLDLGLEELITTDEAQWPASQAQLRTLVVTASSPASWAVLSRTLAQASTTDLLNDLVLLFKYAAVGHVRPVRRVAELYRLARALTDTPGPSTVDELVGWLAAPLVVPAVFAASPGPRGPFPAGATKPPTRPEPRPARIDLTTPTAAAVLAQLDAELDGRIAARRATVLHDALTSAGVEDRELLRRVVDELAPNAGTDTIEHHFLTRRAAGPRPRARAADVVRVFLFGTPMLIDTAQVHERTARVRRELALRLAEGLPDRIRDRLHEAGFALEDLAIWPDLLPLIEASPSYLEPIGRSDLLLVRQQTIGYRRAEIAYVENVLIGEKRTREHTNRVLSRQEFFESVQRESEVTRDLQSTDRAELSREVNNVVNDDLHLEGSVQVTSRGPTKIVASASASFDRSTEDAASTAEEYARETIERAVKRTLERVNRETRSLFEQEATEVNHHGFERGAGEQDHVAGMYQYLERVSHAKLFWYGERELYDIVVPEPAALIWQLAISRPEVQIPVDSPDDELFESLTLENIAENLENVIREFRVTDIPPQPEPVRAATFTFSATGDGGNAHHATAKDVQIPDGYVVTDATFVVTAEVEYATVIPNGGVAVAGEVQEWSIQFPGTVEHGHASRFFNFPQTVPGPTVAVAFNADNFNSIAGSVTLNLQLLPSAMRDWAATAYGRVAERYEQLRREYAQAVIQAAANQPAEAVNLPDGARTWLRQVMRSELQRGAIDVMRNTPVDYDMIADYPYANPDGTLGNHPTIDYPPLTSDGPEVRFLQQAFEWEYLAWVVYPYFWGRRSEWGRMIVTAHPDPDFGAFLNAGAARVQIPVRPGFEDLVKHFMETREVYGGDGLPKMGDPGYVSFIDEQLTSLGAPGEEVAWPPDNPREWDIVAPTSLVLVRSTALTPLPTWDPATGAEI